MQPMLSRNTIIAVLNAATLPVHDYDLTEMEPEDLDGMELGDLDEIEPENVEEVD